MIRVANVEVNLIATRNRNVSVVSSFQRPANVPRTWFIYTRDRDTDTVDRLAEMADRPNSEIRGMIKSLPEFCTLIFSRNLTNYGKTER